MPSDLRVFEGFRYRTAAAWSSAFCEFRAAREAWADEHEGVVLPPYEVDGYCPFDASRFQKKSTG